jgi:hypothetical protein
MPSFKKINLSVHQSTAYLDKASVKNCTSYAQTPDAWTLVDIDGRIIACRRVVVQAIASCP